MSFLKDVDPEIFQAIQKETEREQTHLELIASENFVSRAVLEAQGCIMTNKYAEGYPRKRYYGGCQYVDIGEELAIDRAKQLFGADHVNVQPHSGTQANMAVYFTTLKPGDTMMGLSLAHGGHLTHGHPINFTGKLYNVVHYGVDPKTERLDFDQIRSLAREHKPKLIVAGASAYPRMMEYGPFREIADEVGAMLMVDIAHIAGLIVADLHPSPVQVAEFITTTTHKTLRGPRGGMIFCKEQFATDLNKAVFPGGQGGPLMHIIAAKAVSFKEALAPEFKEYQRQIVSNSKALAEGLKSKGFRLVAGGTDTHLSLVDLTSKKVTGKVAEEVLDRVGITVNKNAIPFDSQKPFVTSGIRVGTPAVTTRGMTESEMTEIANLIGETLDHLENQARIEKIRGKVMDLCSQFPLYAEAPC